MQNLQAKRPVYIAIDLKSYYASVECVARGFIPLTANLQVTTGRRAVLTAADRAFMANAKAHPKDAL